MKYFLVIWLIVFLIFYFMNGNKAKAVSNQKISFEIIETKYFNGIEYNYEEILNNKAGQYASIEIKKNKLSIENFENIKVKIIKDGWEEVSYIDGYYEFCKNKNQAINVLYPTKNNHFNRNGNRLVFDDIDSWLIIFYYDSYGVDKCVQYFDLK